MKRSILSLIVSTAMAVMSHGALTSQLGILDLDANGGINPATGAAWQAGDTYRLVFVSEGTIAASSTDIATYNAFVQAEAASSTTYTNLGTVTWTAIASTATVNAQVNTGTASGSSESVMLINGTTIVANNYGDMWDGAVDNRINRTQNNISRQGNFPNTPIWGSWTAVWSGTNGSGATSSALGTSTVRHGLMQDSLNMWITRSTSGDNTILLPMYGMSEVLTVIPEPSSLCLAGLGGLLLLRRRR